MARRFWSALVVLCFVVVGLVAQPLSSSATTPSYNNIEFAPELYVYTDGSVKTQALDISTTWWADIKQAYQRRTTHNPSGWPTNFISTVDDAVANGGSMGGGSGGVVLRHRNPDVRQRRPKRKLSDANLRK